MRFLFGVFMLATLFVVVARRDTVVARPATAARLCDIADKHETATPPDAVILQLWALAAGRECWRAYGPVLAADQVTSHPVRVQATAFETLGSVYRRIVEEAIRQGNAPDLAFAPLGTLHRWAAADALVPLDDCRASQPRFAAIDDRFWSVARWHGQSWGVPLEANLAVLYFNRERLRTLGWSDAQIAAMPAQIRAGTFTFATLLATAHQAVAEGVVAPGNGFWPSENKFDFFQLLYTNEGTRLYDGAEDRLVISRAALTKTFALMHQLVRDDLTAAPFAGTATDGWLNNNLRRDAIAAGRVLFWVDRTSDWAEWATNYTTNRGGDRGGTAYLNRTVGTALFPALLPNQRGEALLAEVGYYAILAKANAAAPKMAAACALLAQSVTPAINNQHSAQAHYLSVLTPNAQQSAADAPPISAEVDVMREPLRVSYRLHPALWDWFDQDATYENLLLDAMAAVAAGESTPTVAADRVVQRLQGLLADRLLVE